MKISRSAYTAEFKELAVKRIQAGASIPATANELGINDQTLRNWLTGICQQAHYADLVVKGQDRFEGSNGDLTMLGLQEYVVLNSGRPVLVVPETKAATA